ncbi:LCP family protein [Paenarthrobacter sp. Z7-10]|uniref:LCP family protein n=1 Tax=Paenarthrobacter sp. Z7-10 TaxID=2787635 RepID=UPI0022A9EFC3|nr:LCP family protein [Paenarthrobacter sp. Z7-10]MCZ2404293.1 LCP family protein [Paenarthrobacter sp. Z7-10]
MGPRRPGDGGGSAGNGSPAAAPAGAGPARYGPRIGRHFGARRGFPLWFKITAASVAVLLVAVIAGAGVLLMRLQNNVQVADLNLGASATVGQAANDNSDALQILILGTDTRDGANSEYGSAADSTGSGHSDVMMLMNISADNKRVSVISFPRDLMVPIPACKDPKSGTPSPAQPLGQLNTALSLGGPGCTVAAINQLTGMNIDHFMLADFTAVKDLSNVIGGVEVCVDHSVNDVNGSGLVLPKGTSKVKGEQALAFLRTRHSFGDASDLARIKAQQYFLGSMVRKIKSDGTLSDLPKVYRIADAITKNLTIDRGLANIPSMTSIANRLQNVDLPKVAFVTAPNVPDPADPNRVVLSQPDAGNLFAAVRKDVDLTAPASPSASPSSASASPSAATSGSPASASSTTTTSAAGKPAPTVPAYDKTIQPITVNNGTGLAGRIDPLVSVLTTAGYANVVQATAPAVLPATQVLYGKGFLDVAQDLAKLFGIPSKAFVASPDINGVQLQIGSDFASGSTFGKTTLPPDIVSSTANQQGKCLHVNPEMYPR